MVQQMLRKVRVMDPGSTEILPGTLLDIADFTERNRSAIMNGEVPDSSSCITRYYKSFIRNKQLLVCCIIPRNNSCLDRCFYPRQERPLTRIERNVIIGKIIPAGTGMARYRNMETSTSEPVLPVEQKTEGLVGNQQLLKKTLNE